MPHLWGPHSGLSQAAIVLRMQDPTTQLLQGLQAQLGPDLTGLKAEANRKPGTRGETPLETSSRGPETQHPLHRSS